MSLNYVLDQVSTLESFLVGIVNYFERQVRGIESKNDNLGDFLPAITLVEEWLKQKPELRASSTAKNDYEQKFNQIIKNAMEGLLEPYGDLLKKFGYYQTRNYADKLLRAYRVILEEIIPKKAVYFSGNYPEDGLQFAIKNSKSLLKTHFFKEI